MKVLFIGGTGQISLPCVELALAAGHDVTVYNRDKRGEPLPAGAKLVTGDLNDSAAYKALAAKNWDVVAQFIVFTAQQMQADIDTFTGHVGQYIFISSGSVYERGPHVSVITEKTRAHNPWWPYSQAKIVCENMMRASKLPWTNVRPSHTVRTGIPAMMNDGDSIAHRMLAGQPVVVAGDGTVPWVLTRSVDFAKPFTGLLGNKGAIGEDFHITQDHAYTWDVIYNAIGKALGVEPKIVHVPTDTLVAYHADWAGPLRGEKIWYNTFDNSKVSKVAGAFTSESNLDKVLEESIKFFKKRLAQTGPVVGPLDPLMDRIVKEQSALAH